MPRTTAVLNKYGKFRFIDYVSMLPEFLREETDVVTLMQIYTDYINNAYRNTTEATKYEFRLVSTEGHANTRVLELSKLSNLMKQCESRHLRMMYLMNPLNAASTIIEYDGDMEIPPVSIVPGGCLPGDRFYIEFTANNTRNGVYVVVDENGYVNSTNAAHHLVIDSNATSQDPFSVSMDKPNLTAVGYIPRAISFFPSDVSDVYVRNMGIIDGTVYSEVFFSATITDIEDCAALDNYDINGDKFLVDYYGIIRNNHPEFSKIFNIHFDSSVGCEPFSIGRGIFYAKELTKVDTRESMVDVNGNNRYIDPSYASKENTPNALYFSLRTEDRTTRYLRNDFTFWEQVSTYIDPYVGLHSNRVDYVVSATADLGAVDVVENWFNLSAESSLRPGDKVKVTYLSGSLSGVGDDTTHTVVAMSDDRKKIKLRDVDILSVGVGVIRFDRIDFTDMNIGRIFEKKDTSVVFDAYCGDMMTEGEFVIRQGKHIIARYRINNSIINWGDTNSYTVMYVGEYVHYKGIRYQVTKAHVRSEISGTPDVELRYYTVDMIPITDPTYYIDYNPYMFGSYRPRRMQYDQLIDYHGDGLDTLYDQLIVQPTERVGVAYRYEQRDWIFNPRVATQYEFTRNGWMTVFKHADNLDVDIANPLGANQLVHPLSVTVLKNRVTIRFMNPHRMDVGSYIELSGAEFDLLNGKFPIVSVLDEKTLMCEIRESIYSNAEETEPNIVSVRNIDHITNGSVLYSRQNLTSVSTTNPLICPNDSYYKYTLDQVDWSKATVRKVPDAQPLNSVGNLGALYGEYKSGDKIFIDGEVVNLVNQSNKSENGYWRVKKNARWTRCGDKITLKVGALIIDAVVVSDMTDSDDGIFYNRYSPDYVIAHTTGVGNAFISELSQIVDYKFTRPTIAGIDTTESMHTIYDARMDSNTMASKPLSFDGVPDMRYPIAEKIERLAYMKDPNVIDLDLIGYLARFMGYDVSPIYTDIQRSDLYKTTADREAAIRKLIQMLPEFNALKSTEGGLDTILLTFGLVSKVLHMWTEQSDPYGILVPDVDLLDYRYSEMRDGNTPNMVATPHFMVRVEVDGNFSTSLTQDDIGRARTAIINYKPINTVFNGMEAYLKVTAAVNLSISPMNAQGRMQADVGYVIDYDQLDNNCAL